MDMICFEVIQYVLQMSVFKWLYYCDIETVSSSIMCDKDELYDYIVVCNL